VDRPKPQLFHVELSKLEIMEEYLVETFRHELDPEIIEAKGLT
jgi:hypothetical protein